MSEYDYSGFEYLDLGEMLARRDEFYDAYNEGAMIGATYAASAGPFIAPLGPVLHREPTLYGLDPDEIPDCRGPGECSLPHGAWDALSGIGTGKDYNGGGTISGR
jgi:hypothetical protein